MKTVWVVERGSYSDYRVVGVFSSKENAKYLCDMVNLTDSYDKATVAEWPLDPAITELHQGLSQHQVLMLEDGTTERVEKKEFSVYDIAENVHMWRRTQAPDYKGKGIPDVLMATVWAKDETHAVKIVNEHRARMIATGEWYKDKP